MDFLNYLLYRPKRVVKVFSSNICEKISMNIDSLNDMMFKEDPNQIDFEPIGTSEYKDLNLIGIIDQYLWIFIVGASLLMILLICSCFCRIWKCFN